MIKNNWVSILALVISVLAVVLTCCRVEVVITHETFIGIMASFMGAAATIIVGAQIYNSIETKKQVVKLENSQKELEDSMKEFFLKMDDTNEEFNYKMNEISACLLIAQSLAYMDYNPISAYYDLLKSIEFSLDNYAFDDCDSCETNINACFVNMSLILKEKKNKNIKIESLKINSEINDIIEHKKFNKIKNEWRNIEEQRILHNKQIK